MRIKTLLLISLAPMLGLTAAQAQTGAALQRNPACKHIATVQFLDCEVDQIYACPKEPGISGRYFRDEFYNPKGLSTVALSSTDGWEFAETDPQSGFAMLMDLSRSKGTPLDVVRKTGKGSYEGVGKVVTAQGSGKVTMFASVKTTGVKKMLNGVLFDEVKVTSASNYPEPVGPVNSVSKAYLVPKLGYSVEGEAVSGDGYNENAVPHRPMSIALPGAPQFVTTKPAFCSASMG